jgi:hypothetical protein
VLEGKQKCLKNKATYALRNNDNTSAKDEAQFSKTIGKNSASPQNKK